MAYDVRQPLNVIRLALESQGVFILRNGDMRQGLQITPLIS
jgi:hypothetical protein